MRRLKILFVATVFVLAWSCTKDFLEKKITNATVTVLAPANNTTTANNSITFWWNPLDGADSYSFQLVMPDFTAIQKLVADTNVVGNKLQLSLMPGSYQWRIKAINGGGGTAFTVLNLKIDTTDNLASQLVVDIGPLNNFVTSASSLTFSWNAITTATKYNIQINTNPAIDYITTGTSFTSTFTAGSYQWKVKALNDISISQFNAPSNFKIDLTTPSPPVNLYLTGSVNTKIADTLKWKRASGINSTDIQSDSVYIYGDAGLSSVNSATAVNTPNINVGALLSVTSGSFSTPYWWRVRSVDSVGNRSAFSVTSTFTLTP